MGRIKALVFDLDDTLYDCTGSLIDAARHRAARALVDAGLPVSAEKAHQLQVVLTEQHGPRCNVFDRIAEMYELGDDLVEAALDAYNADDVGDVAPFPDVAPTLERLRAQGFRLFMLTSGLLSRQQRKIDRLGIGRFFDEIIIQDKERGIAREECLVDLMTRHGLTPTEIVAVGDRIHSEIRVANCLKMTTVQMIHGRFKSLLPKNELEEPDYRIHHIGEIFDVLSDTHQRQTHSNLRVVAIGGGTGLPLVLQGMKNYTNNLTAIVTVMDSGRSSGVLRRDLGVLPPGDARNCLVALSKSEESQRVLRDLFQYRFSGGNLEGMSFGNLFLAALEKMTGSFEAALHEASHILAVEGRVIPPTLSKAHICAELEDGRIVREEYNVREPNKPRIKRVFLDPPDVGVSEEAIEEIGRADIVVMGPGSLYTSVITNVLVPGIAKALRQCDARIVYVCNIVTQPGQTDGYSATDHVQAVVDHLGDGLLTHAIVNTARPPAPVRQRYKEEGADMVLPDDTLDALPIEVLKADLIEAIDPEAPARVLWEKTDLLRHDPDKLARVILSAV